MVCSEGRTTGMDWASANRDVRYSTVWGGLEMGTCIYNNLLRVNVHLISDKPSLNEIWCVYVYIVKVKRCTCTINSS